ncbi:MAG TPA: nickel pincer cofactor biosynthesis protein LarC [Bacteroidota bacterium]|nr:nickel pincer cofactor biosynthesis protein LarC [Bacteroidota bacterium]
MRIAYLDTISGIAGDMTMAAFVSAGLPLDELSAELKKLSIGGFELMGSHVQRSGISAVHIDVVVSHEPHYHRHLKDIQSIIIQSALPDRVKERAQSVFSTIAKAEAKVHNTTIEKVHFHEVGALDAIVDIVGTAICLELLGVQCVYSSPVKLGSGGFIDTEHGKMPIPTPATVEILKDYPTILTDIPFELTTPTGAAIIKSLSSGVLTMEHLKIESIGYGAGTKEFDGVPNLLRVFVGELPQTYENDELVMVETNIDNMNPEIYPYVLERLLAAGAHDAYIIPIIMKKGRPGILFSVLTSRSAIEAIIDIMFRETTTLGLRIQPVERRKLTRSQREVQTSFGFVKAKVISVSGQERLVPEFEECKRLAKERGLPLLEIYNELQRELTG